MMASCLKIKLGNIPKYMKPKKITEFLSSTLKLPRESLETRKMPFWGYCFVSIKTNDNGEPTISNVLDKLNGLEWKKQRLVAEQEKYEPIPFAEDKSQVMSLNDQVTPLWN